MLALGVATVAILALATVFMAGMKLSAQSRDVNSATEVARQVLERTRLLVRKGGLSCIPSGPYRYDGGAPDAATGAPPLVFPPSPYPSLTVNNQRYVIVVEGQDVTPNRNKAVAVEVLWGERGRVRLETHLHP